MSFNKTIQTLLLLVFIGSLATGCETMEGFGRDVEKVGGEIEEKADK